MPPLPPIVGVTTIDEVVDAIQSIVDWSKENESRLGYFAALYKRITIAIRTAIHDGKFLNGPLVQPLDVTFANRYFTALNGYFHPGTYPPPSHAWQVAFDAAAHPEPIIVQHMLAGVNAHIDLDLGIATEETSPDLSIHQDFNRVNLVLAAQVSGVVDEIDALSPVLAEIYDVLMKNEIDLIDDALIVFRDSAWHFAEVLAALLPPFRPPTIMIRDVEVAKLGTLIFYPPPLLAAIVLGIAAQESRDIVHNIEVLDAIASTPAALKVPA